MHARRVALTLTISKLIVATGENKQIMPLRPEVKFHANVDRVYGLCASEREFISSTQFFLN